MKSVPSATIVAENATRVSSACVKIGSSFLLGGRCMTAGSGGSTPSDKMLMNNICIVFSGAALPPSALIVMSASSAAAVESRNARKLRTL
jgi:hypothetical protein